MSKNKLKRFQEIGEFSNVIELSDFDSDEEKPRGRWHDDVFGNDNPITLELACGKGEYTLGLAHLNPDRNYVGIDIKGARIWKGAKRALQREMNNVRFLRIYIDHLAEYFSPGEVDEIWITFPDPYLKPSNSSKRLTSPKFLEIYRKVLKPGAHIHLKTDSDSLFDFTQKVVESEELILHDLVENVYEDRPDEIVLTTIQTFYEKSHLEEGRTIHYIRFSLPNMDDR